MDNSDKCVLKNKDADNEIILYQPDSTLSLDVRVENETVWLNQAQMVDLFQSTKQNISLHINNIFKEGELQRNSVVKEYLTTAADGKRYRTKYYSLDVIISVGYRVKSLRGTKFRQWANGVLKDYLLRGYSVNLRLLYMESRIDQRLSEHDRRLDELTDKVDFFVRASLPPVEGIFFNGQIFDAYKCVCDLVKSVLTLLDKRGSDVKAIIYTDADRSRQIALDLKRHDRQYAPIEIRFVTDIHDRFLIIDDALYHIGASIKDLGKKLFAFARMETAPTVILDAL